MIRAVAIVAVLSGGCVSRPWTKTDTALEAACVGLAVLDLNQTTQITRDCMEGNPILGPCGDRVPPAVWFPTMIVLHAITSYLLPSDWRHAFQGVTVGFQTHVSITNWRAGYGW